MNTSMENIIDLYKNPLNYGKLKEPSVTYRAHNPLCGDDITVDLNISNGVIKDIRHRGVGCAISQAAISLLTEEANQKKTEEVLKISKEDVVNMLGIHLGPVRLKCALLGLEAIHQAIKQSTNNH